MNVTVYSKPDCVQCTYTKRELDRNSVPYIEIDVTQDAEARKLLQDRGIAQLPAVCVDHDTAYEWWSGFKLDKIRGLALNLKPADRAAPVGS